MKKIVAFLIISLFFFNDGNATNILQALSKSYKDNPKLNAERENLKISQDEISEAKSEFLPTITISGYLSDENTTRQKDRKGVISESDFEPSQQKILIEQSLYEGKSRYANLEKSNIGFELAKFKLKKIEQEILLESIKVYTNLVLSNKKVKINKKNVNLFERQVETEKSRLERGEIGLTDLAQSEASLAGAKAKLIEAENTLVSSKINYEKTIGNIENHRSLLNMGTFGYELPRSLSLANQISRKENPNINIAILELEQSKRDIVIARSELLPNAKLSFELRETQDISSTVDEKDQEILKAEASWPIYSGGKNTAGLNKSKRLKYQKELLLEDATKTNEAQVTNAWSKFQSSKSFLLSVKSQVKAAEIANEGITLEYESGAGRTTLEVIQSNSILLDAKITLENSKRDLILSQYELLAAIGRLTGSNLGLN
tara:strand:- start:982 stop:2277 length:1296 start_codon:yes stop_codon:yes gene_type:complete